MFPKALFEGLNDAIVVQCKYRLRSGYLRYSPSQSFASARSNSWTWVDRAEAAMELSLQDQRVADERYIIVAYLFCDRV